MAKDWSDTEVELIVADYFSMLTDELKGLTIHKSFHRTSLIPLLTGRSESSVEFKHQNISAVLVTIGLPFIKGYKPRYNFQKSKLIEKIHTYINTNTEIESVFNLFATDHSNLTIKDSVDFESWVEPAPLIKTAPFSKSPYNRQPVKINFLEQEQKNRVLGLKGEEIAVQYERYLLKQAGKPALAEKVEWASQEQGDGLGFDILSKNLDGTDKFIEVKTTKLSKDAPFYFSANEYSFSIEKDLDYYLYRIFNFSDRPKVFCLSGRFDTFCKIEPIQYRGVF